MGNCFGSENDDDVTPLQQGTNGAADHQLEHPQETTSVPGNRQFSSEDENYQRNSVTNEPPPPYFPEDTPSSSGAGDRNYGPPLVKMSEEEQMKLAKKLGLLQQIPTDVFVEGGKGDKECIICMVEFEEGEDIRFLPCLHTYHLRCIDEWLLKSFTCPSCMEPVDSALFSSYQTAELGDLAALSTSPAATAATAQKSKSTSSFEFEPKSQVQVETKTTEQPGRNEE